MTREWGSRRAKPSPLVGPLMASLITGGDLGTAGRGVVSDQSQTESEPSPITWPKLGASGIQAAFIQPPCLLGSGPAQLCQPKRGEGLGLARPQWSGLGLAEQRSGSDPGPIYLTPPPAPSVQGDGVGRGVLILSHLCSRGLERRMAFTSQPVNKDLLSQPASACRDLWQNCPGHGQNWDRWAPSNQRAFPSWAGEWEVARRRGLATFAMGLCTNLNWGVS